MVIFKGKEEYLDAAFGKDGYVDQEVLFEATILEEMEAYTGKKISRIEFSCEDEYIIPISNELDESWDKVLLLDAEYWGEMEWAYVYGKSNCYQNGNYVEPYTIMALATGVGGCDSVLLVYLD
jgi:hypothetical protein